MLSICDVSMDQCNCINWKFSTENGCEMFTSGLDRKLIIFIELGGNLLNDISAEVFYNVIIEKRVQFNSIARHEVFLHTKKIVNALLHF